MRKCFKERTEIHPSPGKRYCREEKKACASVLRWDQERVFEAQQRDQDGYRVDEDKRRERRWQRGEGSSTCHTPPQGHWLYSE